MSAFSTLIQNSLTLALTPISLRELLFMDVCPCDIYGIRDELFVRIQEKNAPLNINVLRKFIQSGHHQLFVHDHDRQKIVQYHQTNLTNITRSLSIGDPLDKGRKQLHLLSLNMNYLYENSSDDNTLKLQYQSVKNLCRFLIYNEPLIKQLFDDYQKQKHHYILSQPLISSILLVGVLVQSRLFSEKEIEAFFVASYFKDIGMSAIPVEQYNKKNLSLDEKLLFHKHPSNSKNILLNRVYIESSFLDVIENHHTFSLLYGNQNGSNNLIISGFETMIISVLDIITAMISERPYRKASDIFSALELIKGLMSEQYPQEFRLIVNFFRKFFKK